MELQVELMVFTLFMCLAAGIFGIQGLLALLGRGKALQMPALILSFVALIIGGIGSFLHLQHWDRLFNGFGHITSGITQEFIAIVVFVVVLIVYFVALRRFEELPKWAGALAFIISIALVVIVANSYQMAARPAWNTPLLWLYYLGNAAFFGGLAIAFMAGLKKDDVAPFSVLLSLISGIVSAIVTVAYAGYVSASTSSYTSVGYYIDPTHPTKPVTDVSAAFAGLFSGDLALLFWCGVVIVGLLVPLILALVVRKKTGTSLAASSCLALVCALAGGICFRAILYILGFSVFVFY